MTIYMHDFFFSMKDWPATNIIFSNLVAVVGNKERFALGAIADILADSSITVCLGALEESSLCGSHVSLLTLPCFEDGSLEGATIREGKSPWFLGTICVHGVKVKCGIFLTLATREEGNTWNSNRDSALENGHSSDGNVLRRVFRGAALTRADHVRLEKSTLKVDVVCLKGPM